MPKVTSSKLNCDEAEEGVINTGRKNAIKIQK
jgi:hypothetical protein